MEQEQQWKEAHKRPGPSNVCPFCSTPLSETEYERANVRFQKEAESAGSGSGVKYQRTMKSVRSPHGTEITSVKEQYERFGNSALVRGAVALDSFFAAAAAKSRAWGAIARQKYTKGAARLRQETKRLADRVTRWFNKWVFFVFNRTEEGLSKVSG